MKLSNFIFFKKYLLCQKKFLDPPNLLLLSSKITGNGDKKYIFHDFSRVVKRGRNMLRCWREKWKKFYSGKNENFFQNFIRKLEIYHDFSPRVIILHDDKKRTSN